MPKPLRHHQFLLCAMLAALSVAVGYAFLWVPNVEFITAAVFISGFLTGRLQGVWIGLSAELLFSAFNPYGAPALPLLLAQVVAMAGVGLVGGALQNTGWLQYTKWQTALLFGAVGLILTLLFDLLTNLSIAFMMAQGDWRKIASVFIAGMGFSFVHLIGNTLGFALLVPMLLLRLQKIVR